jgi:N-acetyl-anhydromuramyl-L-alanine amidase AmpD
MKCSLREETVYGHTDLGQDTERGTDPGALFPPKPDVGSRSEGERKLASCINKVNKLRIAA